MTGEKLIEKIENNKAILGDYLKYFDDDMSNHRSEYTEMLLSYLPMEVQTELLIYYLDIKIKS